MKPVSPAVLSMLVTTTTTSLVRDPLVNVTHASKDIPSTTSTLVSVKPIVTAAL